MQKPSTMIAICKQTAERFKDALFNGWCLRLKADNFCLLIKKNYRQWPLKFGVYPQTVRFQMQHMSKKNTKLSDFSSMQRHMAHVIPENFLALGAFKWIEKFCRVHKVAREHGVMTITPPLCRSNTTLLPLGLTEGSSQYWFVQYLCDREAVCSGSREWAKPFLCIHFSVADLILQMRYKSHNKICKCPPIECI